MSNDYLSGSTCTPPTKCNCSVASKTPEEIDSIKLKNVLKISQYLSEQSYTFDKDTNIFSDDTTYIYLNICPKQKSIFIKYKFGICVSNLSDTQKLKVELFSKKISCDVISQENELLLFDIFVEEFENFMGEIYLLYT